VVTLVSPERCFPLLEGWLLVLAGWGLGLLGSAAGNEREIARRA
jgi:hypothetical protein